MSDSKKGKTPVEHEKRRSRFGRILNLGGRQEKSPNRPPAKVQQNRSDSNRPGEAKIHGVESSETLIPDSSQRTALDASTRLDVPEPGTGPTEIPQEAPRDSPEKSQRALPPEAKRYNEAVERLETILQAGEEIAQFPKESLELPRNVADIDGVAKSMSSAITAFMDKREKLKENKGQIRGMVETWYKASFPFVQSSLNIVAV
jgi:hypothetical protein